MRAVLQRVHRQCTIDFDGVAQSFSGPGLVILLGWDLSDANDLVALEAREDWIVSRALGLRVFPDEQGRMNTNLVDYCKSHNCTGGFLWVSQFTLAGQLDSGFRPSFSSALQADVAKLRYERLVDRVQKIALSQTGIVHLFGRFGADMSLSFTNWGPVTICL